MTDRPINLTLKTAFPAGSSLAARYLAGEKAVTELYSGDVFDLDGYRNLLKEIGPRFSKDDRLEIADSLRGGGPDRAERLQLWVEKGGFVVTTGQQPGLFTGPLYSIYKALTTIRLAGTLEKALGIPVLPLYWVASEDHDWDEAASTSLPDVSNELRTITIQPPTGAVGQPLYRIDISEESAAVLDDLREALPDSDFSQGFLSIAEKAYGPGSTLPSGFEDELVGMLGALGLFVTDAADSLVKRRSQGVIQRAVSERAEEEALLVKQTAMVEVTDVEPQVSILPNGLNLFLEGSQGRERIYRDEDGLFLKHSGARLTESEVLAMATSEESSLSPNVLLRPVVESAVFPTVCYVAGPGEFAYWGQLKTLFEHHGMAMPMVLPRHSVTVLEGKTSKVLDKFDLSIADLAEPAHELAGRIARDDLPEAVTSGLGVLRAEVGRHFPAVMQAVKEVDPTLKGPAEGARKALFDALAELEKRTVQAVKRRQETTLSQVDKARLHLFPGGKPQERIFNVHYYLARYGVGFFDAVLESMDIPFHGNES